MTRVWRKRGFTLVELLVVITIIGILIALLLPAVQAAREAARRVQCTNNIKQLALGCLGHESATRRFPTGGWGFGWAGDADRGTDWRQPGGWIYNILPYIEQQPLHDLGMGLSTSTIPTKNAAHLQRCAVPLTMLYCPTRRPATVYPWKNDSYGLANADKPSVAGREDYAANAGDYPVLGVWSPAYENQWGGPTALNQVESSPGQMASGAMFTFNAVARVATGVTFCGSLITAADISDGLSNTCLLGEKSLCPDNYNNGQDPSDNESAFIGADPDIIRFSGTPPIPPLTSIANFLPPMQDTPGQVNDMSFGSADSNGFNMAFCDGSVQFLSYSIDLWVYSYLCNRMDGHPVDPKKL